MPDEKPDKTAHDEEHEFGSQEHADRVERNSGTDRVDQGSDGDEQAKAETTEHASGKAAD